MRKSAEELLTAIREVVGEERITEDAVVNLLEDVSDSIAEDGQDWKTRYEELDNAWKKRYTERFFDGDKKEEVVETKEEEVEEVEEKETTFDDILKEEGE